MVFVGIARGIITLLPRNAPDRLANGMMVCRAHHLVTCPDCGVDYSFMQEDEEEEEEEEEVELVTWKVDRLIETANGTVVCGAHRLITCVSCGVDYSFMQEEETTPLPARPAIPKFEPSYPGATPQDLFSLSYPPNRPFPRFLNKANHNDDEILIYTDGACFDNGGINPAAGCGFFFRPPESNNPNSGRVSLRLEECGPTGEPHQQTSNRAELRAVIAALQYRVWYGEGWASLVIATDSEYVAKGATEWVPRWQRKGWVTTQRTAVKNRDLWELLLQLVQRYRRAGMTISFWRIPRALNEEADRAAKAGATLAAMKSFRKIVGVLC